MATRGDDDLALVLSARDGDPDAFGVLFDRWFDRVFDVSHRILHDRELAAEVSQDVFLAAWQQLGTLRQPESFGGWLLRTSRNRSLNRLQRERRSVALGDEETVAVIDRHDEAPDASVVAARAEDIDLVWAASAALGERDASVLDLHLRHGLGAPEIAEALDVTTNNAHQLLFRLKGRLGGAIRSWVLWSGGAPACPELARVLAVEGIDTFGPAAAKAIDRHAARCEACEDRRVLRLSPEAMFAAVPLAAAGPMLKAEVAAALTSAGVPMDGSEAADHDGQDGGDGDGGDAQRPRHHLRTRVLMGVVAAVVVIGALVAIADAVGDGTGPVSLEAEPAVATTTPTSMTTTTTAVAPITETTSTTAPPPATSPVVPPPAPQPTVPAPPPPPPATDPPPPPATPEPTDPAPPPPTVVRFSGRIVADSTCAGTPIDVVWASEGAETATLSGAGLAAGPRPTSGRESACTPVGAIGPYRFRLTLDGPGGQVSEVLLVE